MVDFIQDRCVRCGDLRGAHAPGCTAPNHDGNWERSTCACPGFVEPTTDREAIIAWLRSGQGIGGDDYVARTLADDLEQRKDQQPPERPGGMDERGEQP